MYSKLNSSVKREIFISEPFKCEIGTCQGCHMSSDLFKIYVNDLSDILNNDLCKPVKLNSFNVGCLMYIKSECRTSEFIR